MRGRCCASRRRRASAPPATRPRRRARSGSTRSRRSSSEFLDAENVLTESRKASADAKSRHAIELGRRGPGRLDRTHPPLRLLPVTVDRAAGPRGSRRSDPARGGRSFPAPLAERPGRDRRAQDGVQPHGREPRASANRARGAERAAPRERTPEVGSREHGLARAANPAVRRARVHKAPSDARVRPGDPPALPRDRRRAGAPAVAS